MGKSKEYSCDLRQKFVELHKMDVLWISLEEDVCLSCQKDGSRCQKTHSCRIADVRCVLWSESLQNYNSTSTTSPQIVWKVSKKKAFTLILKQTQAFSGFFVNILSKTFSTYLSLHVFTKHAYISGGQCIIACICKEKWPIPFYLNNNKHAMI